MDLNLDQGLSVSQSGALSPTALQYLQDLKVKSELRKISETKIITVEDVVELTAAAQATGSSSATEA